MGAQRERERERIRNMEILFNKAIAPFEGVSTINLVMQCTHSIQFADVGMLQMNKAEAKRYVEENITIMSMIVSSSHSYIYIISFSSSTQ